MHDAQGLKIERASFSFIIIVAYNHFRFRSEDHLRKLGQFLSFHPQRRAKSTLKVFHTLPICLRRGIGANKTKSSSSSTSESRKTSSSEVSCPSSLKRSGSPKSWLGSYSYRPSSCSRSRSESVSGLNAAINLLILISLTAGSRGL
jgi:hypothetical protein